MNITGSQTMNNKDISNSTFLYSVNMLRLLCSLKLISQEEYDRIVAISAEHYQAQQIYCV